MKSSSPSSYYPLIVLQPPWLRHAPRADQSLALGEPGVPQGVWVTSVELQEFLQTPYRKVVVCLLHPVLPVWVVEPFDEVQNAAPFLGAPKDLVNIVLLVCSMSLASRSTFEGSGGAHCSLNR